MLVLSRKSDQELVIADCIHVRVLSIDGGRVRLGIIAPSDVSVIRSELTVLSHDSGACRPPARRAPRAAGEQALEPDFAAIA